MSAIRKIHTENAPAAVGPYSQAVEVNGMLYTSGQIPLDPATGNIVDGDIKAQADRAMKNIVAVLEAGETGEIMRCCQVASKGRAVRDRSDRCAIA